MLQFTLDVYYCLSRFNIVLDALLRFVVLTKKKKQNNNQNIFDDINVFYNKTKIVVEINAKTNTINRLIEQTTKEKKNIVI